ncbi:MAG: hypothetical protein KKF44_09065 [Nanoarchaeota archaeon]|nr:hypothetical protein [Nanoarchaeota archaeon]
MAYVLKPAHFFLEQLDGLSNKAKDILKEKLLMLKENPFRFKRIHGFNLFLFRIRFEDSRKEKRVVYLVDKPFVKVLCILDRDNEYKDLKKYLKKLGLL